VFLSPRVAGWLKVDETSDYEEIRRHTSPSERPSMLIVGEANVGLVSVHQDRVVHCLLGRTGPEETVSYTSTITM